MQRSQLTTTAGLRLVPFYYVHIIHTLVATYTKSYATCLEGSLGVDVVTFKIIILLHEELGIKVNTRRAAQCKLIAKVVMIRDLLER